MPATSSKIDIGTVKGSVADASDRCPATSSAVGLLADHAVFLRGGWLVDSASGSTPV
jgi:hypothetical protein